MDGDNLDERKTCCIRICICFENDYSTFCKPTSSKDNTFSKLDKEIPVLDIERLNSIIDSK